MTSDVMKLFMPVVKQADGKFLGILSDTSIDRDDEMMSPALLRDWARMNKTLPALVNHENKMEKLVGGWKNLRVVEKNGRVALMAEPFFFSKEANPLAAQVEKQVNEALANGMNVGISIGARAFDSETVMTEDKAMRMYTKAELLEATWVPIQSNPMASFGHVAKSYGVDIEVHKMAEEQMEQAPVEEAVVEEAAPVEAPEAEEAKAEPVESEEVAEEAAEEVAEEVVEEAAEEAEKATIASLQKEVAELRKELKEYKEHAVLKATVEPHGVEKVQKSVMAERTLDRMFTVIKR